MSATRSGKIIMHVRGWKARLADHAEKASQRPQEASSEVVGGDPFARPKAAITAAEAIRALTFRPERSRPIWRNKHTGKEVVVVDLAVNDDGGFQGGCRQHVVVANEPPLPGPPDFPFRRLGGPRGHNVHPLWVWLEHWEPTGRHVDEVPGS